MAAKEGMQVAARICPDNRCVMMIIAVALFVYRILPAGEKHVRLAKQSSGGVEAVDNFYVKDRYNEKLRAPQDIAKVKKVVLEAVNKT